VFVTAFPRSPEAKNTFPRGRFFLSIPRFNTHPTSCTTLTTSTTQLANHQWLPHSVTPSSVARQPSIMNGLPSDVSPHSKPLNRPTSPLPVFLSLPRLYLNRTISASPASSIHPKLPNPSHALTPHILSVYAPLFPIFKPLMQPWLPPSVFSSSPYTFPGSRCLHCAITPSEPPLTNPIYHLPPFLNSLVFSSLPLTSSQLCLSVSLSFLSF
jgi:hypothetical protein